MDSPMSLPQSASNLDIGNSLLDIGHSFYVTVYPFALRRALLNVLVNALQFAPKGSEVEIALGAAHGRITIEVRDRGPGIPAEQRERIFEMFVTTRPEGTGLGLFLARTAIQRCGGTIEALPRPGGGTIIRITLQPASTVPDRSRLLSTALDNTRQHSTAIETNH